MRRECEGGRRECERGRKNEKREGGREKEARAEGLEPHLELQCPFSCSIG